MTGHRMKLWKLYGLLLVSVLVLGACESEREEAAAPIREHSNSSSEREDAANVHTILFLGDSITAGYGLVREAAYPSLIQEKIDSLGWSFRVLNGGISGDTSSGGLRRLDWLMRERIDVLVVALGGNDGLRGIDPGAMRENLSRIIDRARERQDDVKIVLAGMRMPPNLGQAFTERFERTYPELAAEKEVDLIPFLLEGVGGEAHLNQRDGIHPTAEGQRIIAGTVWEALLPVLAEVHSAVDPL